MNLEEIRIGLFDKKIIVDYNLLDAPECTKVSKDAVLKTEDQIERSEDVFWGAESSSKLTLSPPQQTKPLFVAVFLITE